MAGGKQHRRLNGRIEEVVQAAFAIAARVWRVEDDPPRGVGGAGLEIRRVKRHGDPGAVPDER
jgi:hypothetical protein